jgi:hypothetical protein
MLPGLTRSTLKAQRSHLSLAKSAAGRQEASLVVLEVMLEFMRAVYAQQYDQSPD